MDTFSERNNLVHNDSSEMIREDAPEGLRIALFNEAVKHIRSDQLREIVCDALDRRQDPGNWGNSEYVENEVKSILDDCRWFEVYDVMEIVYKYLLDKQTEDQQVADQQRGCCDEYSGPTNEIVDKALLFQNQMNLKLYKYNIGWKLQEGKVVAVMQEATERNIRSAVEQMVLSDVKVARKELSEAWIDLSKRPSPDITGAIQHARAAMEGVTRFVTKDNQNKFGDIVKNKSDIFPPPLGDVLGKIYGYASNNGAHVTEGNDPKFDEAEFIVSLYGSAITYILKKYRSYCRVD